MKTILICLITALSFFAHAIPPNTKWKSEIIYGQALLNVIIDNDYGIELQYSKGKPIYSRLGEVENFQTERYYSIKSNLVQKNTSTSNIKVYQVENTNFEIVEDTKLNYLKVLEINDSNQVSLVQKIYKNSN
jgi:hypothetical protein